ncbi:MAG: glutamine synthetase family protein [Candidatus Omnitrophica bacterium]|nr:glutamine synthetase family protein [Candidatus Omnitrophota bacterium]
MVETVLKKLSEDQVKYVELWFVDILGQLKTFTVPAEEVEKVFAEGIGFDGSSIEGFARIYESDLIARPDPQTYQILPLLEEKTARFFCNIYLPEGQPYDGDTRYILRRYLEKIEQEGYTFNIGPELEYFYFRSPENPEIIDNGGYFDFIPQDLGSQLRQKTMKLCEAMGTKVEAGHHEVSPSQHEIDLRYDEALKMADKLITLKVLVKQVAARAGYYATFMPKPLYGLNGSGLHIHQSLFQGDKNAFYNESDPNFLSPVAKSYVGGLLKHIREITSICNQWVNSYKRLVPGYEAPVYVSWGRKNRSALIRIPIYKPGKEKASRIELRSPDPACNPYLAFTVILAAGFDGIKKNLPLPPAVEEDIYRMEAKERKRKKIQLLPGSLIEAIMETEKSELVCQALGEHVFTKFIENKKIEWDMYRTQVTSWEMKEYLPVL